MTVNLILTEISEKCRVITTIWPWLAVGLDMAAAVIALILQPPAVVLAISAFWPQEPRPLFYSTRPSQWVEGEGKGRKIMDL
jgi:hypothetical protein